MPSETDSRRVRFGLAMAPKGGRSALVGVEVSVAKGPQGRPLHHFEVGLVERTPATIEGAADRLTALVVASQKMRPCAIIDIGTPQGAALHRVLRGRFPAALHQAHAFPGTGVRAPLFAAFLQAYSDGRITFAPGLPATTRKDLDKALVFYMGGGVRKHGVELSSEEEALVMALGLALQWPRHGPAARPHAERA